MYTQAEMNTFSEFCTEQNDDCWTFSDYHFPEHQDLILVGGGQAIITKQVA